MTEPREPQETEYVLTGALEDYLETIYEIVSDQKLARVRDIAKARGVRAASVTPAMKRLANLGLIRYVQREYIDLTPDGEREARRVHARHRVLRRFFEQVLRMPGNEALRDACAMEHSLSIEGMEHLVRFLEFLHVCPEGQRLLARFHSCSRVHEDRDPCPHQTCNWSHERCDSKVHGREVKPLAEVLAGEKVRVAQVSGDPSVRQELLDMGLVPQTPVEVQRVDRGDGSMLLSLHGYDLTVSKAQSEAVMVDINKEK